MSKQVKGMLVRDYETRFAGYDEALVLSMRGVDANATGAIRRELAGKDIRVTVVKNTLARKAFAGTGLEQLSNVLEGSSALAYGAESVVDVARAIMDIVGRHPEIELKGAILDGELFEGDAGVRELSKYPTRDEAIAQAVTLILSPGRNLASQVKGPGSRIAGIVKTIQDKLEKGEAIGA